MTETARCKALDEDQIPKSIASDLKISAARGAPDRSSPFILGRQLLGLAESYLAPLNAAGVDTLALGCTHYPLLTDMLSVVMGESVTMVSSAEETAKDMYRVLFDADLLRPDDAAPPRHTYRATGSMEPFRRLRARFLGPEVTTLPERSLA